MNLLEETLMWKLICLVIQEKTDLKKSTGVDISNLALKTNLTKLKAEIDKLDVDKLKAASVYLSKLSNVVNNKFVKKTVYDKLVAKVNNCDTSGFVLKTKHDTDKSNLEKNISDADKMAGELLTKQMIMLKLLKQNVKYLVLEV